MKHYIYILVACLLWATPVLGQDSLKKLYKEVESLKKELEKAKGETKIVKDSLNIEIKELKREKSYFTSLLSEQTGIFSCIVAVIVGLVAFFSWLRFSYEVNNLKTTYEQKASELEKNHKEMRQDFEKQNKKNVDFEYEMMKSQGKINNFASYVLDTEFEIFNTLLQACYYFAKATKMKPEIETTTAYLIDTIISIYDCLEKLTSGSNSQNELKELQPNIISHLNFIYEINNEELRGYISQIRVMIDKYCQETPQDNQTEA
jgi:hypothetical protein